MTAVGLNILFKKRLALIAGRSIGLITNQTGIDEHFRSNVALFAQHPEVEIAALFSPEHGIRGNFQSAKHISSTIDASLQIQIHSLYGETRQPTPEMLSGIDVLIYDIQDVGSRFYTYISTLQSAMRAAAANRVDVIVLDRPNPIRGDRVEGNRLQPAFKSFVGASTIPIRHGMTVGELSRWFKAELETELPLRSQQGSIQLEVVPMHGWRRAMWYDQTGLPWVPPSPNMPTAATAALYPGTCLFEGTNLSEGRGTAKPFEWIGAPWIEPERWAETLNSLGLSGVHFRPSHFTPSYSKFARQQCRGVQVHVTDRDKLKPVEVALHLIATVRRIYPDQVEFLESNGRFFIDSLAGTDELRQMLMDEESPADIARKWESEAAEFREQCRPYLLYD